MLLRDLLLEQMMNGVAESELPNKEEQEELKQKLDEITGSVTLNWFLSLFHNVVPWQVDQFFFFSSFLFRNLTLL